MSISDPCSQPATSFQVLLPPTTMMPLIGSFPKMYFMLSFHIILRHAPTDHMHNSLVSIGRSTPTPTGRRMAAIHSREEFKGFRNKEPWRNNHSRLATYRLDVNPVSKQTMSKR